MKASDISDDEFLAAMDAVTLPHGVAILWTIQDHMPEYPPKVVHAKAKSLLRRKVIDGCGCGCRGDFQRLDSPDVTR